MRCSLTLTVLCSYMLMLAQSASLSWMPKRKEAGGQHWAVLVAGSSGFMNYRHQADVCHAYHVLRNHGVPSNRIITMMVDDIAHNGENPIPGVIVNRPNGTNVYKGVKIDYRAKDVTPANFINVLTGNSEATGGKPVLKSGPNDLVFVNFVDHGAPGLIGFPRSTLKAKKLIKALKSMHDKKMFKKLVFYLESCESGSMFKNLLPSDWNIFATTAANAKESSYACYLDKKVGTYVGDLYSVKWMEDSDSENINTESLAQQFAIVKQETNKSHVQEYGDMNMTNLPVGEFQGTVEAQKLTPMFTKGAPIDAIPQEDVPMAILEGRLFAAKTEEEKKKRYGDILQLHHRQVTVHKVIESILERATGGLTESVAAMYNVKMDLKSYDCYDQVVEEIEAKCFNLGQVTEAYRKLYAVVNACESGIPSKSLVEAVQYVCRKPIDVPQHP